MPSLEEQILASLKARPNQLARELAAELGVDKKQVNSLLYGRLKRQVRQGPDYRWSLRTEMPVQEPEPVQYQNTPLAKLARYYLACIGQEEVGVSTFAQSKYGDPDYCELDALPPGGEQLAAEEGFRRLAGKIRTERGRWAMYLGYPTTLRLLKSRRSNWEGYMVEPVFLFGIELNASEGYPTVDLSYPMINQKVLQAYTGAEREALMEELAQLEQELGIGKQEQLIELDELALRLQAIRPEWPWQEDIEPDNLATDPPLSKISCAGIFNRAVVMMAERSPFTQGLEAELRELAMLAPDATEGTALGEWLSGTITEQHSESSEPLIEVLPMNLEQYTAVESALNRPLSVITGPPGTGKSQVVTNLLANAAWRGMRVLFASKNNKAVDVVEVRVNNLGPRPVLLRVGSGPYQMRLAEYLMSLMAATASKDDEALFNEALAVHERLQDDLTRIEHKLAQLIDLRNRVDRLEQQAEVARQRLPNGVLGRIETIDIPVLEGNLHKFTKALQRLDKSQQGIVARFLWPLMIKGRLEEANTRLRPVLEELSSLGASPPQLPVRESQIDLWKRFGSDAEERIELVKRLAEYRIELKKLQDHEPLESLSKKRVELLKQVASNSQKLWAYWLRLQPSRLTAEDRQMLNRYGALLKMVIEAGPEGRLSESVYRQYRGLFPKVSHLLSCWAVTSLSARGKIPFQPGFFDLVVFDEASQCDIASALPLIYRAKRVAIIGDPKQLAHISGLQKGQDQQLLERFGLLEDYPHWAYSVNSLFDLAAGLVSGKGIVNLLDHHRSHADIIEFSNQQFYEGRLRIATRYSDLKQPEPEGPGIRWVDVRGKVVRPSTGGALNEAEVRAVVGQLQDLVLSKGYAGTIGVVCPFRAHANAVRQAIERDEALSTALPERDFLVDTVHRFQGDERDLMIFSPVVSDGITPGALSFLRNNGNLFNVAITRARAQLIVVGDLASCATCGVDYLENFARYAQSLEREMREAARDTKPDLGPKYPVVSNPERVSEWEKILYEALYRAGIRTMPQFQVEKYTLDLALIDGERCLDIEVDGERYHRNWTGELCRRDQIRNQRMFELGWDVIRFWVYEIRDDLDGCVERVRKWLEKR